MTATPGQYGTFSITAPASNGSQHFVFRCPGCRRPHAYLLNDPGRAWTFDGNYQAPTLQPSLLIYPYPADGSYQPRCHLFVRGGQIEFCSDSAHELAGKTVPLPPFSWEIEP